MAIRRIFGSDSDSSKNPFKKTAFTPIADSQNFVDFWIRIADFSNIFKGLFINKKYVLNFSLFFVFSEYFFSYF